MNEKKIVGEKAAEYIKEGMVVGLGTGSTVYYTLQKLGMMVQEGLKVQGVPTSQATESIARQLGIPLLDVDKVDRIDLAIDGADEVDPALRLIKGGGGALLREKIIAHTADRFIVVADSTKCVPKLGAFPLPVEVVQFGYNLTAQKIEGLGGKCRMRMAGDKPFISDNGHFIFDCIFNELNPSALGSALNHIPGVVENGLFVDMADRVITMKNEQVILLGE
ncbi:ribose-5-phosphate isomerase RpiA [Bacillus testis]|uniref:ribose-5-phosphate isomerase RpiA n=1 Tax=Bacillus testis TaxID=1622072 RepID=UPI00067F102F|nr:ribose-5-phosphate isomerase RpiA [Bacillus testis]